MKKYLWTLIAAIVVLVILFGSTSVGLYTDWLWFKDLGFSNIFSKIFLTRLGLGAVFTVLFFVIVYFNLRLVKRIAPPPMRRYGGIEDELRDRFGDFARRGLGILLFLGTLVVAVMVGLQAATNWKEWLLFQNATPFGVSDPIFHTDIGFYVFKLQFINYLYGWLFFTLFVTTVASAVLYYAYGAIEVFANTPRFSTGVKTHLAVLIALMFFLKAFGYKLAMYSLVLSPKTLFTGADYTDIHARLPVLWILLVVAVIAGLLTLLNARKRGITLVAGSLIGLIGISILAGVLYPNAVEQFSVKPNELEKLRPFIANAIKYTRLGFNVDNVASKNFNYQPMLTAQDMADNQAAVQNLRLWDYDPLKSAYQQLQEFQQYYNFNDVDIDRYTLENSYRQVMLSARELSGPPPNAQTWVNKYLRYTHGYAYAMSPVNEVTQEGLPVLFVGGIPPVVEQGIKLDKPQIYFGELTDNYVLVDTKRKEFDYPVGGSDRETEFAADSGINIGSFIRKCLFAIRFGDGNILLSNDIQKSSRILFRRNITERVQTLFPFLEFDSDPYLVTVNGKLYWFQDAYTTTDSYPYSEAVGYGDIDANYIRNSVKIITDAYTGDVTAYISDAKDPIIQTYAKIFKGAFKPMSEMPKDFVSHLRYPEDLFKAQTTVFSKYHMTDPSAFYSGTDLWALPSLNDSGDGGTSTELEPYYIITKLPNSSSEEFILIAPLVRSGKDNMVAWMAAKCDPEDYGNLIAYEFPRGQLVYGPNQVMSRANQDTTISQQLTLWGQQGSRVVRGKLLAIPIKNSILYVEPLYLVSTSTEIPEFKRVIVSLGNKLTMESTLEEALTKLVGTAQIKNIVKSTQPSTKGAPKAAGPVPTAPVTAPTNVRDLIVQARQQYNRALDAQKRGDWAGYGKEVDALNKTLAELDKQTSK